MSVDGDLAILWARCLSRPVPGPGSGAVSFLAAAAAPEAIDAAVRGARTGDEADHPDLTDRIDSITHHTDQLRRNATIRRKDA
ncbi:hypothetical protein [Streptomyces sp. NBC_01727]|uniref:hypothetical protein n=1 Tax=unclassified Streptomyces TaxID=2593676 RepID=UPI002E1204E9|nr:hypothetical protein OIE76_32135 [Streptomyces sp. NBC_01727]